MSTVSVIVPVYKALATLPRCVKSVLAQSFADFELILVDDGSPDASGKLCDAFAITDLRITVIHQFNQGVSAARNAGIRAAQGQWVIFLDADDALAPCALANALAAAAQSPDRLILWLYVDAFAKLPVEAQATGRPFAVSEAAGLYMNCWFSMPWNKLFDRALLQRFNLRFDPTYSLGEDLLFCLEYCKAFFAQSGKGFFVLDTPLTFYDTSENPDSLSQKYREDHCLLWMELTQTMQQIFEEQFHCPAADINQLSGSCLRIVAEGISLLMAQKQLPFSVRWRQARHILSLPDARTLVQRVTQSRLDSPYALFAKWNTPLLLVWRYRRIQRAL